MHLHLKPCPETIPLSLPVRCIFLKPQSHILKQFIASLQKLPEMSNYSPANQLRQDAATTRRKVVSFEDHGMNLSKALRTPPTKSKITKVPIRILAFLRSGASVSLGVLVCLFLFNILRAAVEGACIVPGTSHCQKQDADYYLDALPDFGPALVHIQELGTNATILPMQLEYSKNIVKDVAAIVRFSEIGSR